MKYLTLLWLPILLAAVGVFFASFITHMLLPIHRSDVRKVPADKEDDILEALRRANLAPGDYAAPHAGGPAGMKDPVFIAKAKKGPLAFFTISPGAVPSMGPYLAQWFVYCLVVSAGSACFVFHLFGRVHVFGGVFRLALVITFLCYAAALPQHSIWYRRSWATTVKSMIDAVIYGLVTGAAFAYLWPK